VDHDLHQLLRMQRDIQVVGEVCGVAAAEAVKRGIAPRALSIEVLRPLLVARGIQPRPPQKVLDLPVEELLARLRGQGDERGLAMWRLSRLGARVDWTGVLGREQDPGARFCAAVAAALGGVASEPVTAALWDTVRQRVAEPALGTKSPARYVVALLALAELRVPGVAAAIGELLRPELAPSDLLLLLRALAVAGDPAGVAVVRDFLRQSEGQAFPIALWGADAGHPTSFRDAVILRAVRTLAALGSTDERWRAEGLCDHAMLLVRRHARHVLAECARDGGTGGPSPSGR